MCGRYTLRNSQAVKDKYLLNIDVSYNISPSHQVLTYTTQPTFMKWSYNPIWAKTPLNLINARSETLNVKPSFKMAKRCLIIADGWFEWLRTNNSKQPFFFHMNDELLYFAGIYTKYKGEEGCAIITKEATKHLSSVHNRMPVIIADNDSDSWLSGKDVFDSKLSESIDYYRVSTVVNSPRNNNTDCVKAFP